MSDDLVKRLREIDTGQRGWGYAKHAADRIEELEAENADLKDKLAKAVKALECAKAYVEDACKRHDDRPNIIKNIMREMAEEDFASICTTIAELTGGKDDA